MQSYTRPAVNFPVLCALLINGLWWFVAPFPVAVEMTEGMVHSSAVPMDVMYEQMPAPLDVRLTTRASLSPK